jgi:hypothetical protein
MLHFAGDVCDLFLVLAYSNPPVSENWSPRMVEDL